MGDILGKLFIDPKELPNNGFGLFQVVFLGAVYGFVLFNASNLISDGSEFLLLVPALAGIVGSVVLPVLGAVPDGAIVLFSGMGPNAQEQLSVGVGALAGSTIMLLTIPWALSVIAGRVSILGPGKGNYKRIRGIEGWKKLHTADSHSLSKSGVVVGSELAVNGKMMLATALIYLVIQIPALGLTGTAARDKVADPEKVATTERSFAFAGMMLCTLSFGGYLIWNVRRTSQIATDTLGEYTVEMIRNGEIGLSGVMAVEMTRMHETGGGYGSINTMPDHERTRLEGILKPFFRKYDVNGDGKMDKDEVRMFFKDLQESLSTEDLDRWYKEADADASGFIEFSELVEATAKWLRRKWNREVGIGCPDVKKPTYAEEGDGEEEEEEEEIPEDLAHLSVEEQQHKIKIRAAWMMTLGTILVLLVSDPMVDVLSEIGKRTGIPAFYISFIVAPLASNASELISSYNYALKKTSRTISISLATLLGAACMNNTFCLGIFMALMYFKGGLVWEFSAETISIMMVQFVMGYFALRNTQTLGHALMVLLIYPLSIALVAILQNGFGLD